MKVTKLGTIADHRAENYNDADGVLVDASGNNLDGTGSGVTLVGMKKFLSVEDIAATGLATSAAGLASGRFWVDTADGNTVKYIP